MPARRMTLSLCLVATTVPATAQRLARLIDTNPTGNGNAWIVHQAPTRTWLVGGGFLWRSDGTTAGTQAFHALAGRSVRDVVEIGERVFFASQLNHVDQGLVVLDAAATPTQLLPGAASTGSLQELHGQLLFRRTERIGTYPNFTYVTSSWLSDGTVAGTRPAPHIPVDVSNAAAPWCLRGDLLITVDGTYVSTLHVTDGQSTTALTTVPRGIGTGPGFEPVAHGNGRELFFVKRVPGAASGQVVRELWRTDGTVAGTVRVYDPAQAGPSSLWMLLGCIGERACFAGGASLRELWQSDGTAAGTTFVTTLPGVPAQLGFPPVAVDGGIYFPAADASGAMGVEPMFTDGTAGGTSFLGDLTPGAAGSGDYQATPVGGRSVLLRGVFAGRYSLWSSAGTPASTGQLVDLATSLAANWSWPHALTRGRYVLIGTDAFGDQEIWSVDGSAAAQQVGHGIPRQAAPDLRATRPVLGATATLRVVRAHPGAGGALVLGLEPSWIPHHAGLVPVYVDLSLPTILVPIGTDASGDWSAGLPLPNTPTLRGTTVAMQVAIFSTAAGLGFDVSNGLLATLGN